MLGGTPIGVRLSHFNHMFLGAVSADVLQMTVIEIVHMIMMSHGCVATAWPMDVRTCTGRLIAGWHCRFLSSLLRLNMEPPLHLRRWYWNGTATRGGCDCVKLTQPFS
jgi:hypothetical protein